MRWVDVRVDRGVSWAHMLSGCAPSPDFFDRSSKECCAAFRFQRVDRTHARFTPTCARREPARAKPPPMGLPPGQSQARACAPAGVADQLHILNLHEPARERLWQRGSRQRCRGPHVARTGHEQEAGLLRERWELFDKVCQIREGVWRGARVVG